jgi:hypothetical protein
MTQFYDYGSGRFGHYDTDQDRGSHFDYESYEEWDNVGIKNLGRLTGNAVPPLLGQHIGEAIF